MASIKYCSDPIVPATDDCNACLPGPCEAPCVETCGCTPEGVPCAQPFYDEAPALQSSSCDPKYVSNFYSSIRSSTAWNIPSCGATAVLKFGCIKSILIGSNIWNGTYGYFEVTGYDTETGNVTVKNNCVAGNAAPGTAIPACSEFVVAPPPCCTGGAGEDPLLFPYVAIDFTAQANGACQQITVTSVNGIAVGKNIQVGTGTYRVGSVDSASLITICNDGGGISSGTSVIAKNPAGDYQYPIILIDTNPCTNPKVTTGSVIVCHSNLTQPLTGIAAGSVLVLTDPVTGEAAYQVTGQPTFTCSILTETLTLSVGQASYTVTVHSTSNFAVADILQIGSRTDRFTVTSIPDATHLVGTLDPIPGSIQLIPIGTSICLTACCEVIQAEVTANKAAIDAALANEISLRNFNQNQLAIFQDSAVAVNATGTVHTTETLTSNQATVSITNTGALAHNIVVTIGIDCQLEGALGSPTDPMLINFRLSLQKSAGILIVQARVRDVVLPSPNWPFEKDYHLSATLTDAIAPTTTETWVVEAKVSVTSLDGVAGYLITKLQPRIFIAGVRV